MKIFLTVGTRFPMDRLVSIVDDFVGENSSFSCVAQIGDSQYIAKNCQTYKTLDQKKFTEYAKNADVIISHAGIGNILLAAGLNKPMIAMARQSQMNEHINDHQVSTLEGLNHKDFIYSVEHKTSLHKALEWASEWNPQENKLTTDVELIDYIKQYLNKGSYKKVLAVSSAGGHWTQLQTLMPVLEGYDVTFLTTIINSDKCIKKDTITVCDADMTHKIKLLWLACQTFFYVLKIQPDVVISTGAAPGFFTIFFAKLFKKKTIWLDSIANYERLSVSGKYAKRFSDVFLVQWPHLESEGDYKGSLI